jgi:hypothetical protein
MPPVGYNSKSHKLPYPSNPATADPRFDRSPTAIGNVRFLYEILKFSRFCFYSEI